MVKKKYVKPEIREESYILTVKALITAITSTSVAVVDQVANTSVAVQSTSVAVQDRVSVSVARAAARK